MANRWSWVWLAVAAWGAVLAGAGLAAVVRGWELRIRTPLGCQQWLRVESFRRFLAGPQAYHLEEPAKQGLLGAYTAWAVAVGEIDPWSRVVAASACCANDPVGRRYSDTAPHLPPATRSSTVEPSSSGGSSGGDFGGSGGSGGGEGGGGGGSWRACSTRRVTCRRPGARTRAGLLDPRVRVRHDPGRGAETARSRCGIALAGTVAGRRGRTSSRPTGHRRVGARGRVAAGPPASWHCGPGACPGGRTEGPRVAHRCGGWPRARAAGHRRVDHRRAGLGGAWRAGHHPAAAASRLTRRDRCRGGQTRPVLTGDRCSNSSPVENFNLVTVTSTWASPNSSETVTRSPILPAATVGSVVAGSVVAGPVGRGWVVGGAGPCPANSPGVVEGAQEADHVAGVAMAADQRGHVDVLGDLTRRRGRGPANRRP
jgi:hypothetical protein